MGDLFNFDHGKPDPFPAMPDLSFDPRSPDVMAAQLEAAFQSMFDKIRYQGDGLNEIRAVLDGANSDDIDVERDPGSKRSYWQIPDFSFLSDIVTSAAGLQTMSFRHTITGAQTVLIESGTVFKGRSTKNISDVTVTFTGGTSGSPQYAYMRFPVNDLSSGEVPTSPLGSMPVPNDTYWQVPLLAAYYNGSNVVVVKVHHEGDIYVPDMLDQT